MINKIIFIYFLFSLLFFTSCYKVKYSDQCLGKWEMLDDDSHKKSFILKKDGKVEFHNLSWEDFGLDEEEQFPKDGTWMLFIPDDVFKSSSLDFLFRPDGEKVYRQGGTLVKKKGLEVWFTIADFFDVLPSINSCGDKLEVWITVGDPDDFNWKRFRLVTHCCSDGVK